MLGKRTVRSPRATIVLALTTGSGDFSSTVNSSLILSLQTGGLEKDRYCLTKEANIIQYNKFKSFGSKDNQCYKRFLFPINAVIYFEASLLTPNV